MRLGRANPDTALSTKGGQGQSPQSCWSLQGSRSEASTRTLGEKATQKERPRHVDDVPAAEAPPPSLAPSLFHRNEASQEGGTTRRLPWSVPSGSCLAGAARLVGRKTPGATGKGGSKLAGLPGDS